MKSLAYLTQRTRELVFSLTHERFHYGRNRELCEFFDNDFVAWIASTRKSN